MDIIRTIRKANAIYDYWIRAGRNGYNDLFISNQGYHRYLKCKTMGLIQYDRYLNEHNSSHCR